MLEPVGDEEGIILVEVAVVEHQKKLAAVGVEPLDGVRNAGREIPEIADAYIVDEVASLRVDRGNAGGSVKHVGPFGLLVPMQLAHSARIETHVHAGNRGGNAELAPAHLTGPSAGLQPPVSSRICASANENRRFGRVP